MKLFFSFFLILTLGLAGCSSLGQDKPEKTARLLILDGMEAYENGKFINALENFEQLKSWYPFSKYAILAELKIADANYHLKRYPEAVTAYEDFERLHPRNEAVPYVFYQIGRCHFEQIDTVDRDQKTANEALGAFQRLVHQFPEDRYSRTARLHIVECLQSIMGRDFYVGKYYFKTKQYNAALHRFLAIVNQDTDVGLHHDSLLYIARCRAFLKDQAERAE
jgi:outer membrane protein assembly factor BamD